MDRFNDVWHPENPEKQMLSDSEASENELYLHNLQDLNTQRRRKKEYSIDDWCMIFSDDLWYLWCIVSDYTKHGNTNILDRMDYSSFCSMCYENSSKY